MSLWLQNRCIASRGPNKFAKDAYFSKLSFALNPDPTLEIKTIQIYQSRPMLLVDAKFIKNMFLNFLKLLPNLLCDAWLPPYRYGGREFWPVGFQDCLGGLKLIMDWPKSQGYGSISRFFWTRIDSFMENVSFENATQALCAWKSQCAWPV